MLGSRRLAAIYHCLNQNYDDTQNSETADAQNSENSAVEDAARQKGCGVFGDGGNADDSKSKGAGEGCSRTSLLAGKRSEAASGREESSSLDQGGMGNAEERAAELVV
jgi:hypothetical protein